MASIKKWENGIVVRWDKDDWMKGLASVYGTGTDSRPTDGMMTLTAVDPFRLYGFLSPGYTPTAATNSSVVAAYIRNGVAHGNKVYAIENGAKVHEISNRVDPSITTPTTFPHTITPHGHASAVGSDIIAYYLNQASSPTKYIFYSWNDSADGDVGRYDLSTTFDDDYMSTTLSGTALNKDYNHPMIVGEDNILYVGNGKDLASLDGTTANGVWNDSALDLPDGYEIQSFSKTRNYLVVYANYNPDPSGLLSDTVRANATAFFWDMVSDSFTYAIPLSGNLVSGGFVMDGIPGCFVQGQSEQPTSSTSKILMYDGSNFETVVDFDLGIPIHGGVEVTGKLIRWNSGGQMFTYGSAYKGEENSLQKISQGSGTTSGLLRTFNDSLSAGIIMSSGATTSGGYEIFNTGKFHESGRAQTGQKQLPTSGRDGWQIDFAKVNYYAKVSSGTRFQISVSSDASFASAEARGSQTYLYESASGGPASITQISKIYSEPSATSSAGSFPLMQSSVGMIIDWSGGSGTSTADAPCVEFIELYLKPLNINQST